MPVKRRKPKDRNFQITPEAIELFRRLPETSLALHLALERKPWQWPVEDAIGDRPGWKLSDDQLADYREAAELRLALIKAARD